MSRSRISRADPIVVRRLGTPDETVAETTWAGFARVFAASADKIEGAAAEDGRGPSIWDTFARQPRIAVVGSTMIVRTWIEGLLSHT